ncbi:hypothetical protein HMPREF0496_1386, partial [Lentilactobacillus hilgardii ATCC 27305]
PDDLMGPYSSLRKVSNCFPWARQRIVKSRQHLLIKNFIRCFPVQVFTGSSIVFLRKCSNDLI